jgi:hypothetical protein
MMLLTALLANETRSAADVARAVSEVGARLALWEREHPEAAEDEIAEHAVSLLDVSEDGTFAKRHLFARPAEHLAAAAAVPDGVWLQALLIGLRAVTTLTGFSVCRGWSDFDPAHREVKAEFLLGLVEGCLRQVDAELFGLPGRRREIRDAIDAVLGELALAANR